ncbi:2237_t:CDS:2 [Ambispora gerdemannii]|uniref:2237_t:CDS:1 n=1 Tax=Ambispora gerdemannii TaxID=144530 RepID=A0A9N9BFU8_9GLOM|nr:2237_t:CDS:2 [Ambispora gerdemannii]
MFIMLSTILKTWIIGIPKTSNVTLPPQDETNNNNFPALLAWGIAILWLAIAISRWLYISIWSLWTGESTLSEILLGEDDEEYWDETVV